MFQGRLPRKAETGLFHHDTYPKYITEEIQKTFRCQNTFLFKDKEYFDIGKYEYKVLHFNLINEVGIFERTTFIKEEFECDFIIAIFDACHDLFYMSVTMDSYAECCSCDGTTHTNSKIIYSHNLKELLDFLYIDNGKIEVILNKQRELKIVKEPNVTLIYGDSLCENLFATENSLVHVEANPGKTIEQMLQDEENNLGLSFYYKEDKYYAVIFIGGFNDPGHGILYKEIVDKIIKLLLMLVKFEEDFEGEVWLICFEFNKKGNDDYYEKKCEENGFTYDDFFCKCPNDFYAEDGLHLNDEGKEELKKHLLNKYIFYY